MPIVDNPLVLPPLPIIRSFSLLLNSSEDKIKVSILYAAMEKILRSMFKWFVSLRYIFE